MLCVKIITDEQLSYYIGLSLNRGTEALPTAVLAPEVHPSGIILILNVSILAGNVQCNKCVNTNFLFCF